MPSLSRPTATHDDDDVALFSRPFSSENLTTSLNLFRDGLVKANDDEVDEVIEQLLSKVISAIGEKANIWKRMRKSTRCFEAGCFITRMSRVLFSSRCFERLSLSLFL